MDYIKIRFTDDFDQLESEFEKTFGDMFRAISPMFTLAERKWKPQITAQIYDGIQFGYCGKGLFRGIYV